MKPTPDATAAYAYDGAKRLIAINSTVAAYGYFGAARIKKVTGATTTRYVYSGGKPIAEYVNGANVTAPSTEYIYAGSQLLVTIAGSTTTYHHPDHLSNRAKPIPREPGRVLLATCLMVKPGMKLPRSTNGNLPPTNGIPKPERRGWIMLISGTTLLRKAGS